MSTLPVLGEISYDVGDDDLVRFKESAVDDAISNTVRSMANAPHGHLEELRRSLGESEVDTLLLFARRQLLHARRTNSTLALGDALDAYALVPVESDVPWESWFKATLLVAREMNAQLDDLQNRFSAVASERSTQRANVAFDALTRIENLAQCHIIQVSTRYGVGLIEMTVVRDQSGQSWGGITGIPVALGQYQVHYAPTVNLAHIAVSIADALDASSLVTCSSLRQDQLVATTFDLVTSGSYVDSLGCFSFFADALDEGPHFSLTVAEVASEEYDDVRYDANELAAELAEAADAIEEQSALSWGPCVVVLCALPDFTGDQGEESADLSDYLDIARAAISAAS